MPKPSSSSAHASEHDPEVSSGARLLRVAVVGAGLVGGAVGYALSRRGAQVTFIDAALDRAVDTVPRALLHPATGPRAAISQRRRASFDHARSVVTDVLGEGAHWWPTGCLRITSDAKRAEVWAKTAVRWPDVAEWIDRAGVIGRVGTVAEDIRGGLWIPDAIVVDAPALVRRFRALATASNPAGRIAEPVLGITERQGEDTEGGATQVAGVEVRTPTASLAFDAVVIAAPAGALLESFGVTHLRRVAGAVVLVQGSTPVHAVGERGQIIPTGLPGRAVVSATHEHDGAHARVDEAGIATLMARARGALPDIAITADGAWSGYRHASRDRVPMVGALAPGVWACTAFGSKGLLLGLWSADQVAARVVGDAVEPLPAEWDPMRGQS